MKRIILNSSLVIFLSLFSCDKKINALDIFSFDIVENHQINATIGIGEPTAIDIIPKRKSDAQNFEFRYFVTNGAGFYTNSLGEPIEEGVYIPTESLRFLINFVGAQTNQSEQNKEVEPTEVSLFIRDRGVEEEITLNYLISDNPFTVELSSNKERIIVNKMQKMVLRLANKGINQNISYTANLFISKGEGELVELNNTGEVIRTINENESFPVSLGNNNYGIISEDVGLVEVTAIVTDSNGQKQPDELTFNAILTNRSFSLTATRALATVPLGNSVAINYSITEKNGDVPDSYTMLFSTTRNGTLTVNGIVYTPGELIPVPSLNFTAIYSGLNDEEHLIKSVIVAGSNGLNEEQEVSITYTPATFTLNVKSNIVLTVGDKIPIDFVLNQTSGNSILDISYSVKGDNQIMRNEENRVINPNIFYDTTDDIFSWEMEAIKIGKTIITYTAVNQFGAPSEGITIEYTIEPVLFDYSVKPEGTSFNIEKDILFNFKMNAPNTLTYQFSFVSNGEATVSINGTTINDNEIITISNSDFSIIYNTKSTGPNIINWKIKASNGIVVDKNSTITVLPKQFRR